MSAYSPFADTLSVTPAPALLVLLRSWDYDHASAIRTARPGLSTLLAACYAAGRLEIIAAYRARLDDWSALDAYLETQERERIEYELGMAAATAEYFKLLEEDK